MTADLDDAVQLATLQQAGKTPPTLPRYRHKAGERTMRMGEVYAAALRLVRERRLACLHGLPAAMLAEGWPDLVVLGPRGALFRKLLDEYGQLSPDAAAILNQLKRSGINVGLWRPEQLHDGTAERELDMIAPEHPRVFELRCEECQRIFTRTQSSARFCGGTCRMRHARRAKKLKAEAGGYA